MDSCQSPRTHCSYENTGAPECPNHIPAFPPAPTKLFLVNPQFCLMSYHQSHSPAFGGGYNQPNTIPDNQSRVSRVKENGVLTRSATSVWVLNLSESQFLHLENRNKDSASPSRGRMLVRPTRRGSLEFAQLDLTQQTQTCKVE